MFIGERILWESGPGIRIKMRNYRHLIISSIVIICVNIISLFLLYYFLSIDFFNSIEDPIFPLGIETAFLGIFFYLYREKFLDPLYPRIHYIITNKRIIIETQHLRKSRIVKNYFTLYRHSHYSIDSEVFDIDHDRVSIDVNEIFEVDVHKLGNKFEAIFWYYNRNHIEDEFIFDDLEIENLNNFVNILQNELGFNITEEDETSIVLKR